MKKLKLIYSLAIVMLLCSCKKEKEFDNFPVTLYANEITSVSGVRLFVGKTEITNKDVIDKFISNADNFILPIDVKSRYGTINFQSKDNATFKGETDNYFVQKKDKQFLFYSSSTFTVIVDYVNMYRIGIAKGFLLKNKDSISQISLNVGFATPNNFNRVFKKYEGVTPGQFRQANGNLKI